MNIGLKLVDTRRTARKLVEKTVRQSLLSVNYHVIVFVRIHFP